MYTYITGFPLQIGHIFWLLSHRLLPKDPAPLRGSLDCLHWRIKELIFRCHSRYVTHVLNTESRKMSHVDTHVWEHMVTQFCSRKWATSFRLSLPAPEIHPGRVACRDAAEVVRWPPGYVIWHVCTFEPSHVPQTDLTGNVWVGSYPPLECP